ncbi:rhoptry protein, partial [Reticulomyxa filosa]
MFEQTPIWKRAHIIYELKYKYHYLLCYDNCRLMSLLLPLIAYRFSRGPWRLSWVRHGLDPQALSSRYIVAPLQTVEFRLSKADALTLGVVQKAEKTSNRTTYRGKPYRPIRYYNIKPISDISADLFASANTNDTSDIKTNNTNTDANINADTNTNTNTNTNVNGNNEHGNVIEYINAKDNPAKLLRVQKVIQKFKSNASMDVMSFRLITQLHGLYQLNYIDDDEIRSLINDKENVKDKCSSSQGWFNQKLLNKIRARMNKHNDGNEEDEDE